MYAYAMPVCLSVWPQDDRLMPAQAGVGFLDVGCGFPGTYQNEFTSADFERWSSPFYKRLTDHVARACASVGYVFLGFRVFGFQRLADPGRASARNFDSQGGGWRPARNVRQAEEVLLPPGTDLQSPLPDIDRLTPGLPSMKPIG
jgi:hypothetical protein